MKEVLKENKFLTILFFVLLNIFLVVLIVFIAVAASNGLKQGRYIGQGIKSKDTLVVSGKGIVYTKPDLAKINFSVRTEAKTAAEAMKKNANKTNDIISVLKEMGINKKDLKTTNFSVYPRYEWHNESRLQPINGKRVLVGYEAQQTIEVKIRNLEKIGKIIQAVNNAGASQTGNLQFLVDKKEELENQARKEAIKKAKEKAKELSSELGIKLVKIVGFSENKSAYPYYSLKSETGGVNQEEFPQIETGENKIEVNVSITYEIN